jgi:hypothetical protein
MSYTVVWNISNLRMLRQNLKFHDTHSQYICSKASSTVHASYFPNYYFYVTDFIFLLEKKSSLTCLMAYGRKRFNEAWDSYCYHDRPMV